MNIDRSEESCIYSVTPLEMAEQRRHFRRALMDNHLERRTQFEEFIRNQSNAHYDDFKENVMHRNEFAQVPIPWSDEIRSYVPVDRYTTEVSYVSG